MRTLTQSSGQPACCDAQGAVGGGGEWGLGTLLKGTSGVGVEGDAQTLPTLTFMWPIFKCYPMEAMSLIIFYTEAVKLTHLIYSSVAWG